jgi:hypothetical protein
MANGYQHDKENQGILGRETKELAEDKGMYSKQSQPQVRLG